MIFNFRNLYSSYDKNRTHKNKMKQLFCKKVALVYIPIFVLLFVVIYWFIGLKNAQFFGN